MTWNVDHARPLAVGNASPPIGGKLRYWQGAKEQIRTRYGGLSSVLRKRLLPFDCDIRSDARRLSLKQGHGMQDGLHYALIAHGRVDHHMEIFS